MSERVRLRTPRYLGFARTVARTGFAARKLVVPQWETRYRYSVIASDVLATVVVVLVFGVLLTTSYPEWDLASTLRLELATVLAVAGSLSIAHVWHPKFLGQGAEEFGRLGRGLFGSVVVLGLGVLAVGVQGARLWVFTVIPAIAALAFPQRYLLRKLLHRARIEGRCLLPVLAAGDVGSVTELIDRTRATPHVGWRVEAVCTTDSDRQVPDVSGIPVVGELDQLAEQVRRGGYRIVAVTPDRYWTPVRLQRLAWDLEGTGAEMVVAPGLMEVAGPRLHISGVLGMPLLWVSEPALSGFPRVIKAVVDRVAASLLLVILAPLILVTCAGIRLSSRGPVFYRQRRVGRNGSEFMMIKFRTMVAGADKMRDRLHGANEASGPMFKLRRDPRITRFGAVLRRYSVDELPQLFNVLSGQMSLVGPRPPLPDETATYEPHVRRKLLVKPGVTGLWQVSGRSDLSWEETVRLDLRYVEDWSLALDFVILWKTIRAVLGGRGAY